jgi:lipid-binding SYLF domain-containing protein
MNGYTRRGFIAAATAPLALAACGNGIGSVGSQRLDARVDSAFNYMYSTFPESRALADKSVGILMMPLVTEAGVLFGGAYGRGALRVGGATVDYYSVTNASAGLQIGAQQYSHALFFLTEPALRSFRASSGWVAGADLTYAVSTATGGVTTDTTTLLTPVVALVFGQAGLIAGATIEGQKYTRILP